MNWRLVPTEEVGAVWHTVAPLLATAVERDEGRRTLHDVLRSLVNGQAMLWIVSDGEPIGAIVTARADYAREMRLRIDWLAGERFEEWAHLVSEVVNHARHYGFAAVEFGGRPGLAKTLEKHGFEIVGIEARKLV
jgi:citrate lyase beta subunit